MRLPDGRLARPVPQLNLSDDDIIATYAGVRPVIDSGKADPSKETRDHALWLENGLLTVTGGKLTTFRVIALDASSWPQRAARRRRCKARWRRAGVCCIAAAALHARAAAGRRTPARPLRRGGAGAAGCRA
jgi:glycerol-3-phosphate dehydrogenase